MSRVDRRAVSTVVDACLCLLLVGASVATLSTAPLPAPDPAADAAARPAAAIVATHAARVPYRPTDASSARTAEGTVARLLATAAVVRDRCGAAGERFVDGVGAEAEAALAPVDGRTRLLARWRPYPGAPARTATVGPAPPPDAAVDAVELTVPVTRADPETDLRAAARAGFEPLATAVARAVHARRTGDCPLAADGPPARRRAASVSSPPPQRLVDRIERALRRTYGTPAAAAEGVAVDRVRVVVRTWSA